MIPTARLRKLRRKVAAVEARIAYPVPKRAAARLNLSARTIQRWRNEDYDESSPFYRVLEAIDGADDPVSLLAFLESVTRRVVMGLPDKPTPDLIADYRELLARDAAGEGEDNGNKVRRGLDWVDRYMGSRADARDDLAKAAYELEFAYRGTPESEVFDG